MCCRPFAATSACGTWKDAQAFRSTSALVGRRPWFADAGILLPPVSRWTNSIISRPCVDHGYLKVLVVTQALVAEMLGKYSAVLDCFNVGVELDSIRSRSGTPSFISKKMFASPSPRLFCRSLGRGKSPTQGGYLRWFAGVEGLVPK
jgi:hypothetical protein